MLDKVADIFPATAKKFNIWRLDFERDAVILTNTNLVSDSAPDDLPLPQGCEVKAVITQKEREFAEDKIYTVNKDLWDKISPEAKAGVMLNAFFSRDSFDKEHYKGARTTRRWNALFASDEYKSVPTDQKWYDLLSESAFNDYLYKGKFSLAPSRASFHSNGALKSAIVPMTNRFVMKFQNQEVQGKPRLVYADWDMGSVEFSSQGEVVALEPLAPSQFVIQGIKIDKPQSLELYENGVAKSVKIWNKEVRVPWRGMTLLAQVELHFHPNGKIKYVNLSSEGQRIKTGKLDFMATALYFDADGNLEQASLARDERFQDINGRSVSCNHKYYSAKFDKQQRLISCNSGN
ncbi:hypothetical protein D3C72_798850 [compost metagenome]